MNALVAVLLFVPAAVPADKELSADAKKEIKKFEGKWTAAKVIVNGKEEAPENADELIIEFAGNKIIVRVTEGDKDEKLEMEITAVDPSTTPKCIDLKWLSDKGGIAKGTVLEGIYKLDGDTLQLAINPMGGTDRPDKFESPQGSKFVVITFERVKK